MLLIGELPVQFNEVRKGKYRLYSRYRCKGEYENLGFGTNQLEVSDADEDDEVIQHAFTSGCSPVPTQWDNCPENIPLP